ncbi:unnamed protein product [Calicophoron daubneyi]|uniref:BEN domain-containing protein n=1 Tax=Calicophoron daubneyi TaxID=300641 RepID=A0AAV2TXD1_CALDB
MDVVKTGRRRIHDPEFEETNQLKRKRKREIEADTSDSVQIVGETHASFDLKGGDNHLRGSHAMDTVKRLFPNGACDAGVIHTHGVRVPGAGRAKERITNGAGRGDAHSSSAPSLPPSLRESDRMLYVQQWINKIPPNLPLWVQTSLTRIVPISSSDYFYPEEEGRLAGDRINCGASTFSDTQAQLPALHHPILPHSQRTVTTSVVSANHLSQAVGCADRQVVPQSNPPNANILTPPAYQSSSINLTSTDQQRQLQQNVHVSMHGYPHPQHHPTANGNVHSHAGQCGPGFVGAAGDQPLSYPPCSLNHHSNSLGLVVSCDATGGRGQADDSGRPTPIGRLFDDLETQMVVKLFRDYFTKGSCPVLSEVRRRAAGTMLENRRTATSIRAKIKRLQTSGRWTDYTEI